MSVPKLFTSLDSSLTPSVPAGADKEAARHACRSDEIGAFRGHAVVWKKGAGWVRRVGWYILCYYSLM